jgi:hypothetical protein
MNAMADPANDLSTEFSEAELHKLPPARVLAHIQKLFNAWGIYNQKLTVQHEGDKYAFSCHDQAFVVYRLLPAAGRSPGSPGWPVCLVTAQGVVDECSPPFHEEDYFASHLGLADWLALIQNFFGDS